MTGTGARVELVRTIGRWTLTGLILNAIIGSGFFGVPSAVVAKLGALAPLGWVVAAAVIGCIVASIALVGAGVIFLFFGRLAWLNVRGFRQGARASNLFVVAMLALAGINWAVSAAARARRPIRAEAS